MKGCIVLLTTEHHTKYEDIIVELIANNIKNNLPEITNVEEMAHEKTRKLGQFLEDGSAICYGCIQEQKLKGIIWAYKIQASNGYHLHITEFGVLPSSQGRGIGRNLFSMLENSVKDKDEFLGFELLVSRNNTGAVRFYENLGFDVRRFVMYKSYSQPVNKTVIVAPYVSKD